MNETVNQETQVVDQTTQNANSAEKTFSQADVDRIVAERLQRDRTKYAGYDEYKEKAEKYDQQQESSKTELQKATDRANKLQAELDKLKKADSVRQIREKVATDNKIPVSLLTGETEEACTEQAKAILAFARPDGYPAVSDGGEVTTTGKRSARDAFAEWGKDNI